MTTLHELDPRVAERMGHPTALRATAFVDRGLPIEIALIGPREPGGEYAVTIHYDCDPDREDQGVSEFHGHPTLEDAERDYEEEFTRISAEIGAAPSP
jgi:hypothetical protein